MARPVVPLRPGAAARARTVRFRRLRPGSAALLHIALRGTPTVVASIRRPVATRSAPLPVPDSMRLRGMSMARPEADLRHQVLAVLASILPRVGSILRLAVIRSGPPRIILATVRRLAIRMRRTVPVRQAASMVPLLVVIPTARQAGWRAPTGPLSADLRRRTTARR